MRFNAIVIGLMLTGCLLGCGKKSALEGKVTDAKGKPMSGVRVVAKQLQQDKGETEITTGADGIFKFDKLAAATEYELIPYLDANTRSQSQKIVSAPKGETMKLTEPLAILFVASKDGLMVRDTASGRLWVRDAGKSGKMDWNAAVAAAKQSNIGGFADWRLPMKNELKGLAAFAGQKPSEALNKDAFQNIQPDGYWSSNDEGNKLYAWAVNMKDGKVVNDNKATTSYYVWLVRQEK